jgi:KDO2-lipid IV(A) lauroyltransferase
MASRLTARLSYSLTWMGIFIGRLAVWIFPHSWLFRVSDAVARIVFRCASGFRTRSAANIAAAFGPELDAAAIDDLARRALRNFLRSCVEIGIALEASEAELRTLVPVVGRQHLDEACAKGAGVIVLSVHLGNFFLIGTRLAIEGYPVFVLVNQPRETALAKLMDLYRLQIRQQTIHARPRREALKALHRALRRNDIALIIADEYRRGHGVEVPLFGRTVIARRGPATIALRTGAAVVPVRLVRLPDDSLQLVIEPELQLDRSGRGTEQIRENVVRITRWVEQTVYAYPDQWNWMNIKAWSSGGSPRTETHEPMQQAM